MSTNHDLDFATGGAISANGGSVGLMLPSLCTGTQYAITGTWVGTLTLQASYDNATWVSLADVSSASSYTSNNTSLVKTSPYQFFQIKATAWTSGTANIKLQPVSNLAPTSEGGGATEVTIGDPTTATNQAAVLAPGSSGSFALAVQGVTGGTPQPVSAASLPLPTGASTAAKQPALGTAGSSSADVISVQGIASMTALKVDGSAVTQPVSIAASVAVTGTFWQATQPISAASLPLPTGASTAAKQPALGTAGTASSDVITVQGIASMTALKVDGSAVTQPVSGTFWQATQPVSIAATINNAPQVGGSAVSATNPLPTTAGQFARTDKSGTITSGGTAQDVFATGNATHGFYFQNISTVSMYIRDDGTAASAGSGSILVPANGGYYESPPLSTPTSKLSVFCATTSSAFTCKVW